MNTNSPSALWLPETRTADEVLLLLLKHIIHNLKDKTNLIAL